MKKARPDRKLAPRGSLSVSQDSDGLPKGLSNWSGSVRSDCCTQDPGGRAISARPRQVLSSRAFLPSSGKLARCLALLVAPRLMLLMIADGLLGT